MTTQPDSRVPPLLSQFFVLHCIADLLFAVPLFAVPELFLQTLGWQHVDAYTARITAAALFGIGIESWRSRHASLATFRSLLDMKVMWSLACVAGIALSILQKAQGAPLAAWGFLLIFVSFNIIWTYWRIRVDRLMKQSN